MTAADAEQVPELWREDFKNDGRVTVHEGKKETHFLTPKHAAKHCLSKECSVDFSESSQKEADYFGFASALLSSAYKFQRKQNNAKMPTIHLKKSIAECEGIVRLAEARNRSKEWANGRGDEDGVPQYFEKQAH